MESDQASPDAPWRPLSLRHPELFRRRVLWDDWAWFWAQVAQAAMTALYCADYGGWDCYLPDDERRAYTIDPDDAPPNPACFPRLAALILACG